jgi:uncharacterized protein (TIGR02466 family)
MIYQPFGPPIYRSTVPVDSEIKYTEYSRIRTADSSDNKYILNDSALIQEHIDHYVYSILKVSRNVQFYITNSWINRYGPGDSLSPHIHNNSLISGCVYIDTKPGQGNLVFHHTAQHTVFPASIMPDTVEHNEYNSTTLMLNDIVTGDIILFPSSLMHSVTENTTNDWRYVLAFNVFCKGTMGDLHKLAISL